MDSDGSSRGVSCPLEQTRATNLHTKRAVVVCARGGHLLLRGANLTPFCETGHPTTHPPFLASSVARGVSWSPYASGDACPGAQVTIRGTLGVSDLESAVGTPNRRRVYRLSGPQSRSVYPVGG